jgi:hypothetical protein
MVEIRRINTEDCHLIATAARAKGAASKEPRSGKQEEKRLWLFVR